MSRLEPIGISAWSYLNATGMAHFAPGRANSAPRFQSPQPSPLTPHPPWLGLPGHFGQVSIAVEPLPAPLLFQRSRATELLLHTLAPLRPHLLSLCEHLGAERVGIVLGSSTGGIDATERAVRAEAKGGEMPADFVFEEAHVFSALVRVAQASCGARGPAYVVSTACSSAAKALGAAQRLILAGVCDAVLTGGVDSLSELTLRGFGGLSILSPTLCKPFDGARDGISLGEGASLLVVTREASSGYLLAGVGESSDAYHATAPHPDGLGAELSMRACLQHSGLEPGEVDYVNAHGTGTLQNDQVEAMIIDRVLGAEVPYSSTKDRTGHQLGTAGATEAIVSLLALMHGELPLNRSPDVVDASLRRQPLTQGSAGGATPAPKVVLSNSFAFGGSNVTVALSKGPADTAGVRPVERYFVLAAASWGEAGDTELPAQVLQARARGRASPLTRIFAELFGRLVDTKLASALPMFFGSAYGEMSTTITLLDQMLIEPTVSPAKFQASVHNTAAGLLSITTVNRAPASAIAAGEDTVAMTLADACAWISCHGGRALAHVADEHGPERLQRGRPFPAFGTGFLLGDKPLPGAPPLGSVSRPTRAAVKMPKEPSELENPAYLGLPLVRFLSERGSPGREAEVALGPAWRLSAQRTPA